MFHRARGTCPRLSLELLATGHRCTAFGPCEHPLSVQGGLNHGLQGDRALRGEAHREAATHARFAGDVERRVMARDGMLDDGEAEAGAAGLARAAAVDAVEALGEAGNVLVRDADARVLHAERSAVEAVAPKEPDLAALRRVADRVRDQVAEGACQLRLRAKNVDRRLAIE